MRVLVLDDELKQLTLFERLLCFEESIEMKTVRVRSLSAAVGAINEYEPHLVFIDHEMEQTSGKEVIGVFRPDSDITFVSTTARGAMNWYEVRGIPHAQKGNKEEICSAIQKEQERRKRSR